jgi:Na+/proline symporter/predicted dehydrogenase
MLGVRLVDWMVIIVYLVGITFIGVWAVRRVRSSASFFIGDRKFGKVMMAFFMFGSGTHSDQAVGVAAKTYRAGASGIWYQWLWLFVTPFFWLIAPFFRRMRAVTTGDYFEVRYSRSVSGLYAVMGILQLLVAIGVMLKGTGMIVEAVSGGTISCELAIIAMTVIFVIYGVAGGLTAAIATNFVQGLLTIVLSFLILPFAFAKVGGMSGLRDAIADPAMLSLVAPQEITFFFIAVIAFNALVGWVTMPETMANCAAGKTEMEGRIGVTVGIFGKRICTVAWMLTGLCAVAIYASAGLEDADLVYGRMARELLPDIAPGLIGLFIASMLASVMSTCDSLMVVASALFTENIYKEFLVLGKPDRHYTFVGRIVSIVIVICGILFAFSLESVVHGLELFWQVSAMMGIAFWVGLFWRRATVAGAWAATLSSFAVLLFTSKIAFGSYVLWDFNEHLASKLPAFMLWQGEIYLPWQMIMYLTTGFVVLIAISLLTQRVPAHKLDRLYNCLRTPISPNEPETEPFTLPPGVEPSPRDVIIRHRDFEIPRPSAIGIFGFLAAWLGVGLLIGAVYWIIQCNGKVRLLMLDPGHYHAALVQKSMYEQVDPVVHVYAPDGPDVENYLKTIERFNSRAEAPTHWQQKVYSGDDFLEKMLAEKPGDVVVISGNNRRKAEYIKACVDCGLNVFCDKPMCIDSQGFRLLEQAFASARRNRVLLYDIMTERFSVTCILQRLLVLDKELFGELETGSPENPAIVKQSVHHFFKYVSGAPIQRPAWYFDTAQQGEGLVDVTTHLIDLVMCTCFPDTAIDYQRDVVMEKARRWPTMITREQYEKVTGLPDFPDFLKKKLNDDGILPYYANGEMIYTLKGVCVKLSVSWNFEAPQGGGDTHYSLFRGSKAHVIILQGKEQDYRPELYVEPAPGTSAGELAISLKKAVAKMQGTYPGLKLEQKSANGPVDWHVVVPDEYRIGHEAHFRKVMEKYLTYLAKGRLPQWEVPNMIAKYYITTKALEMAQQ